MHLVGFFAIYCRLYMQYYYYVRTIELNLIQLFETVHLFNEVSRGFDTVFDLLQSWNSVLIVVQSYP